MNRFLKNLEKPRNFKYDFKNAETLHPSYSLYGLVEDFFFLEKRSDGETEFSPTAWSIVQHNDGLSSTCCCAVLAS